MRASFVFLRILEKLRSKTMDRALRPNTGPRFLSAVAVSTNAEEAPDRR